jgi:hypothetical protein
MSILRKAGKQTGASGMYRTDCSANARDVLAVVVTRLFNAAGIRAATNDARESLGFQHKQKRRRAVQFYASFLGPIEIELLAAA